MKDEKQFGIRIWMRQEPEGHKVIIISNGGFKKVIGLVPDDPSERREEGVVIAGILGAQSQNLAGSLVSAPIEDKSGPSEFRDEKIFGNDGGVMPGRFGAPSGRPPSSSPGF